MGSGGSAAPSPNGDGKKSLDFQLNMVPFIDLLSVLISFLLMTAVWTQVAKIDVQQAPTQPGDPSQEPAHEPLSLVVLIKASGYTVSKMGKVVQEIERKGDLYDRPTLSSTLKTLADAHPENREVTVTSEDRVPYQELIAVMDACLDAKLSGIKVSGIDG